MGIDSDRREVLLLEAQRLLYRWHMDRLFSHIHMVEVATVYPFERPPLGRPLPPTGNTLRHPFLVTPIDESRYLLLDDTALFTAVSEAGIIHVPVVVCPPDELRISCPPLALAHFSLDDLQHLAARHPEQIQLERPTDAANYLPLHLSFGESPVMTVYLRHSSMAGCSAAMDRLFAAFGERDSYYPLIGAVSDSGRVLRFNVGKAILTLPEVKLHDLVAAATSTNLYPDGVVQVQPAMRVYNIDVAVSILAEDSSLEDKEQFLQELIALRLQTQRTTSFRGHVYILNR